MARIFITGSADGLGELTARELIKLGHQVVLHARNKERGQQAMVKVPGAEDVLIGDLSSIEETKALAAKANASGRFDVIIHNAGVYRLAKNSVSADGLPMLFAVNTVAPYILTCLIEKPTRLIYLSSDMHLQGNLNLDNLPVSTMTKENHITYSDTKLHDLMLTLAVARRWTDVIANAINPGWVPTKMGGAGAPDSLAKGYETQVWLAASDEPDALVSGCYFHHKKQAHYLPAAKNAALQDKLLAACERITGVKFDEGRS